METFFISGHMDLTETEFNIHYKPTIDETLKKSCRYVIGHSAGADTMSLEYLLKEKVDPKNITIYFYDKHNPESSKEFVDRGLNVVSGFTSYTNRDAQMTTDSTVDILWIRPKEEAIKLLGPKYKEGYVSGTERNLLRRKGTA